MKKKIIRLACGLDIGKDKFRACFGRIDQTGHFTVKSGRFFDNTTSGIKAFLVWTKKHLTKLNPDNELPFQVLMETTGVYHESVCLAVYEADLPVCLEVAKRVKRYLQSIGMYSKTDKLDAKGICQMACERKFKPWKPCSPNILKLRTALRHRKSLVNNKTRLSNQLHAMAYSAYTDKEVQSSIKRLIKQMEREIEKMEGICIMLYQADEMLYEKLEPIINALKGVGLITALTLIAETNGFSQITSSKQLASYVGYDIIENQSGNSNKPTRISKRGNTRIRSQMYMSAVAHIRSKEGPIYQFFLRVQERNPKFYKIANVAVQRKLLLLIYTLYKNETQYDPLYHLRNKKKNSPELSPELYEIEQV